LSVNRGPTKFFSPGPFLLKWSPIYRHQAVAPRSRFAVPLQTRTFLPPFTPPLDVIPCFTPKVSYPFNSLTLYFSPQCRRLPLRRENRRLSPGLPRVLVGLRSALSWFGTPGTTFLPCCFCLFPLGFKTPAPRLIFFGLFASCALAKFSFLIHVVIHSNICRLVSSTSCSFPCCFPSLRNPALSGKRKSDIPLTLFSGSGCDPSHFLFSLIP